MEFKKKKKYIFWHSPIFLFIFFGIIVLFSYNIINLIQKERETAKNRKVEMDQISKLRIREAELTKNIERLSTDEGIEESIRSKYQLARADEKVINIVDKSEPELPAVKVSKSSAFWNYLKNIFK